MSTPDPAPEAVPSPGRGRPRKIDLGAVSTAAVALWSKRGFEQVGWAEIAEAGGISTRTLLRHVGAKEDLAWTGVPAATRALRVSLAAAPMDMPTADALREAVTASSAQSSAEAADRVRWLRVISSEPALAASSVTAHQPWIATLEEFIAQRHPRLPAATVRGIAVAYQVTAFEALLAWAQGTMAGTAGSVVATALRALPWELDPS